MVDAGGDLVLDYEALHATTFTIYDKAPGASEFSALATGVIVKTFTIEAPSTGTHALKVLGHNSLGDGTESAVTSVLVAAPGLPGQAVITSVSVDDGSNVSLAITTPGASFFDIYRKGPGESAFTLLGESASGPTFNDPNPGPGLWHYQVAGRNELGTGPLSMTTEANVP